MKAISFYKRSCARIRHPHCNQDQRDSQCEVERATIYDKIAKGMFPRPIKLGERSVGWLETEIIAWQQARVPERDGTAPRRSTDRLAQ